jgi:hypothetical protein
VSGNEAGLQPLEEERNAPRREHIIDKRPTAPPRPGDSSAARRRQEPAPEPVQDYEVVDADEVTGPPSRAVRPDGPRSGARSAPQDDYEVVDEDDHRPRRKSRRRDDDYEEEDDFDDDYDDEPRRRPRRRRARRFDRPRWRGPARKIDQQAAISLGIGIFLLVFLALTPLLSWIHVSGSFGGMTLGGGLGDTSLLKASSWEGPLILGFSLAAAVFVGVTLAMFFVLDPDASDMLSSISGGVALAWSSTVVLWMLGFIWKIFAISLTIHSKIKEAQEKAKQLNPQLQNNPMFNQTVEKIDVSLYPGVGLWLCLLAAIGVAALFSYLVAGRRRSEWLLIGYGVGLLVGILLVVFNVKPWETIPDLK